MRWRYAYILIFPSGIEVTTGPLGQGISNAVGLAIAQAHLGAVYNKEGFELVSNYTYGGLTLAHARASAEPPNE